MGKCFLCNARTSRMLKVAMLGLEIHPLNENSNAPFQSLHHTNLAGQPNF